MSKSEAPQARTAETKLETALELCRIAKRKPKHLHLYAQIMRRSAELSVEAHKTFGLLMAWRAHVKRGDDPVWVAVLSFKVQQSILATHKKYNQALRLAQATAKSRYRWITARPVAEIAMAIGTLARVLESCDFKEAAEQYHQSAFELLKFSAAIATENKSMDELFNAVMHARTLERNPDGEIFKWVRSVIDNWREDSDYRKNAEELMARAIQRLGGATFEGDIKTNHRQIHYNILTSEGIDPTEEPWVSLIELAIKDDDPTRVLIGCEYKNIISHPAGDPMLVRLALERANPKEDHRLYRHRYAIAGRALDNIDQSFKAKYCDACPDRVPRPAGWTFYDEPS